MLPYDTVERVAAEYEDRLAALRAAVDEMEMRATSLALELEKALNDSEEHQRGMYEIELLRQRQVDALVKAGDAVLSHIDEDELRGYAFDRYVKDSNAWSVLAHEGGLWKLEEKADDAGARDGVRVCHGLARAGDRSAASTSTRSRVLQCDIRYAGALHRVLTGGDEHRL